jgi:integrase/recombinase XerD
VTQGAPWIGFIGKGGGWYEQDLDYATLTALDRYLGGRTEGPLFLNERGNRLRRYNVQYALDRYCRICEITYRVTPHALRRTYARTAIESGADIFGVSEHMRHSDTKTTQLYIGENTGRGKAAAAKVSTLMAQMSRVS